MTAEPAPAPRERPRLRPTQIGIVGSPSGTGDVTIDIVEKAANETLLGDMVYTYHPLNEGRYLIALGTVNEIETHNRWHEDPNMRGVLRIHGSLPHLSAEGDVRTANVRVQAVFESDAPAPPFRRVPTESGGALGMSPTTGAGVNLVDEDLVQGLIASRRHEVVYLGRVYRSDVRLPMFIRDFASEHTDGAFHTGIFGRTGSGKTALAAYMLAQQLRHTQMSVFVFDPQGQFSSENQLPISPQDAARSYGREVIVKSVARDLQLPPSNGLLTELLEQTRFFSLLTIKRADNRQEAIAEIESALRDREHWYDHDPEDVLRALLEHLHEERHLNRVYARGTAQTRFSDTLEEALQGERLWTDLLNEFTRVHAVFNPTGRTKLLSILRQVTDTSRAVKPYVVINVAGEQGSDWLDQEDIKARIIRTIAFHLRRLADRSWTESGRSINCSVIFDEAARFAPSATDGSDAVRALSAQLVENVRETRKVGLGWTFIAQETRAIHEGIYNQLSIRAYGYGLTSGAEFRRVADDVGATSADLYRTFANPRALQEKVYPFMVSGPISPLSFTSAPVFLEVATSAEQFAALNRGTDRV
ncbi:helicase HerA domain-containing protein [Curtobacterium sp. BRD11]|uniref:ATP-binding protein n=1 Tax=Curtobacterium sp. BRD11 TaxID=2962581 RepID=UPI002881353E|nr:DUF87 domain-containing protein [Curtobacterium sp. BRD11]MDT0212057.1 DUF87 domain-containing protein [Curtobacterium sp. BRD11]